MTTNLQTLELLKKINDAIGWHGVGERQEEQFYCEHCNATHLNYSKIQHSDNCIVTKVRAAIGDCSKRIEQEMLETDA